jgi:hypothetical protein
MNLYVWCSVNVILVKVNTTMVKDQAYCFLLLLLSADFLIYTAGLFWIEWQPFCPKFLLAHARSPGTKLTDSCYLLVKLKARPVSVLLSIILMYINSQNTACMFSISYYSFSLLYCCSSLDYTFWPIHRAIFRSNKYINITESTTICNTCKACIMT